MRWIKVEDKIKIWYDLKVKEQENRIVQLKQEHSIIRVRLDHVEDLCNTLLKAMRMIAEGK